MLRRITLSLAFAASIGVGSAQLVPNSAWSILAPVMSLSQIPTVEWSSTGADVVLTTNSAVELLNGTTLQLIWSRTITSAEPSLTYGYSDAAHFTPDGTAVWVRTGANNTFSEISTTTGLPILTHTFSDWGSTPHLLVPVGKELVAYNVSLSGSTLTYNVLTYDSTSLAALTPSGGVTLTHPEVGGSATTVTVPVGTYGGTDYAFFFNNAVNARTGAVKSFGATGTEDWVVAADPQGGLLEQVETVSGSTYTSAGIQRVTTSGTTWSSSAGSLANAIGLPTVAFLSSTSTPIAITPTSTGIAAMNYMTGASLWSTSVETGATKAFTYEPYALNPVSGTLLLTTGTAGYASAALDTYAVSAAGLGAATHVNALMYGVADAVGVSGGNVSGSVIVDPISNYLDSVAYGGTSLTWGGSISGGSFNPSVSPSGDLVAILKGSNGGFAILNAATGASIASTAGDFNSVSWGTESVASGTTTATLVGVETNNQAVFYTLTVPSSGSATLTLKHNYEVSDFLFGSLTPDGKWLVGVAPSGSSANIYVFNPTATPASPPSVTNYLNYTSYWQDSFDIVPLNSGNLAFLEQTSTGAQWNVYQFIPGSGTATPSSVKTYPYTPPFTRTVGDRIRGAITPDQKVAAFFESTGVSATTGTPTSELAFVRLADNKVLAKIDNVFSYVGSISFSPDEALLYISTGGQSANTSLTGAVTLNQSGPNDLQVINVPAWLTTVTASPTTVASGGTSQVTVTINTPAEGGGQPVNVTASTGVTVPTTVTIPAGQTSVTFPVTCPAVATVTTCTVAANVNGLGALSTTITDNPPMLTGLTISPNQIESGSQTTGTITLTGIAPTTGWNINLAQTGTPPNSLVSFPASVNVTSGNTTATFTISTASSTAASTATIQGTDPNSVAKSATLTLLITKIKSVVFESNSVTGGDAVSVIVTIDHAAPTNGFVITLTDSSSAVSFPSTATIPAGATSVEITGTTTAVASATSDTFKAVLGSSAIGATLTVTPPTVEAVEFVQHTVVGGNNASVVVLLSGAAATGTTLTLSSSASALNAPATEAFTAGKTEALYSIPTTTVTTTTAAKLTVTLGTSSGSDTVTVHSNP